MIYEISFKTKSGSSGRPESNFTKDVTNLCEAFESATFILEYSVRGPLSTFTNPESFGLNKESFPKWKTT